MITSQSAAAASWLASYPDRIDWAAAISEEPLTEAFDRTVANHGERRCIDFLGKVYSYREIGALVNRATNGLQELGVSRGVNVGLLLPSTPYFVICYYAILKAGGTVVNFNPLCVQEEIDRQVEDSQTRTMDEDGYLFLVDRIKDLIVCGGVNVYPGVVAAAIYRHPAVAEVTVIGVPDGYRGEAPKAFVRLKDGAEIGAEGLLEFLQDRGKSSFAMNCRRP